MSRVHNHNRLGCFIAAVSISAIGFEVQAQETNSAPQNTESSRGLLEEVIVSAERREETLQDTPLSIVAFGADQIEQSGVTGVEDLQSFVPNLIVSGGRGVGSAGANFIIRGVGSSSSDRVTGDRGVGLYVDDIYFPRTHGSLLKILDVERIEVLRGPQGTLFGKNNTGGAIRYITKRPDLDELSGEIKVSVGEDDILNAQGILNVPISDKAALRAQVASLSQDGWVKKGNENLGESDDQILRLLGHFEANDSTTVDIGYTFVDSETSGSALDIVSFTENNDAGFFMTRRLNDALVNQGESPLVDGDSRIVLDDYSVHSYCLLDGDGNPYTDSGATTTLDYGPLGIEESSPGCATPSSSQNHLGFIDLNFAVNDEISLRLLTGFTKVEYDGVQQFFSSGTWASRNAVDSETISQELQLSGVQFDDRLNWVAGIVYSLDKADQSFVNYWLNPFQDNFGVDAGFKRLFSLETTSTGAFGEATYRFNDSLSMTAGLRYSKDEKDFVYQRHNHFQGNPLTNDDEWSSTDYRLSLEYSVTDDVMVYFTNSTAYRAGGFNDGASNALDLNGNGIADPGENNGGILPFDPETVDSFEIGMRSEWFGSLRVNTSLFSMSYSDIQAATLDISTSPPTPLIANVGEADIEGIEMELMWAATENLTFNASLGAIDVSLGEFRDPVGDDIAASGLPGSPELSFNLGLVYEKTLSNGSDFSGSINYGYTDEVSTNINPILDYTVDDYGTFNARVDYTLANQNWTLSLLCNNCTDETYSYGASAFPTFWGGIAEYRAAPRRIQAQVKYRF